MLWDILMVLIVAAVLAALLVGALGWRYPAREEVPLAILFVFLVLFFVLWSLRKKSPFDGFLAGLYLIGYGVVRFGIEFFRNSLGGELAFIAVGALLLVFVLGLPGGIVPWLHRTYVDLRGDAEVSDPAERDPPGAGAGERAEVTDS